MAVTDDLAVRMREIQWTFERKRTFCDSDFGFLGIFESFRRSYSCFEGVPADLRVVMYLIDFVLSISESHVTIDQL